MSAGKRGHVGTIYFRTHATPKVKSVRFDAFALNCPSQRKILDVDADLTGDVSSQFTAYSIATNRALAARTLGALQLPAAVVDLVAAYPDTLTCIPTTDPNPNVGGAAGAAGAPSLGAAGAPSNQGVAGSGAPPNAATGGSQAQGGGGNGGASSPNSTHTSSAAQSGDNSDSGCSIARPSHSNAIAWCLSALGLALLARRRRAEQTK